LVLARARRTLQPPGGVELALAGDTLRATGAAPLGWVAAARAATLPPGASVLDLGAVTLEIPAGLAELRQVIERERILFAIGSSVPGAGTRGTIDRVADAYGRLEAGAAALGARATLELVGRTDPTGSDAANQTLSLNRAEEVLQALAARGVPRSATRVSAVGTSRPLPGDDPAERARINRSVSFQVSLGLEPGREPSR
ncbi:MAG TPA: OmpA family protein, partial [Gemmatimonadales bacterium]|nr:OmpA family protein [Gemmatimonadales bacterium]